MNLTSALKRRPDYPEVMIKPAARRHLFLATREGFDQLRALYERAPSRNRALILFSLDGNESSQSDAELDELAPAVHRVLDDAPLASAVYVAGHETFLWDVHNIARIAGFREDQIQLCEPVDRESYSYEQIHQQEVVNS